MIFISERSANSRNVSFETLHGGQFMLSTQMIIPNYFVILSHRRGSIVSSETDPLYSFRISIILSLCYLRSNQQSYGALTTNQMELNRRPIAAWSGMFSRI